MTERMHRAHARQGKVGTAAAGRPPRARFVRTAAALVLGVLIHLPVAAARGRAQVGVSGGVPDGEDPGRLLVSYSFQAPVLTENGGWADAEVPGLASLASRPGAPRLPVLTARILLPPGTTASQVKIAAWKGETRKLGAPVRPGGRPFPLVPDGPKWAGPVTPDETIYPYDAPWPGDRVGSVSVQRMRGFAVLVAEIFPVRYLPKSGTLEQARTLELEVPLEPDGAAQSLFRGLEADFRDVERIVDNPWACEAYLRAKGAPEGSAGAAGEAPGRVEAQYLVITTQELAGAGGAGNFDAFLSWKESQGTRTHLATVEEIYADPLFAQFPHECPEVDRARRGEEDTHACMIRNYIAFAYQLWGTEYVLLAGDGDVHAGCDECEPALVPAKQLFMWRDYEVAPQLLVIQIYDVASDLYYGCLDGDFDGNGNGFFGEPDDGPAGGDVDMLCEVHVGRVPADGPEELQAFFRKARGYHDLVDPALSRVLMAGEYLFDDPAQFGADTLDRIKDGTPETLGVPAMYETLTLYDRDLQPARWAGQEMAARFASGLNTVHHLGHSNNAMNMRIWNPDAPDPRAAPPYVNDLGNSVYPIVYTEGCYAGAFDNQGFDDPFFLLPTHYGADAISEHLLFCPGGAAAMLANCRFGWGARDVDESPSYLFHRAFADALYGEEIRGLAEANDWARAKNAGLVTGAFTEAKFFYRWILYDMNLLGDPQLGARDAHGVGPGRRVEIQDEDGEEILDRQMYVGQTLRCRARSYDDRGNLRGDARGDWSLHAVPEPPEGDRDAAWQERQGPDTRSRDAWVRAVTTNADPLDPTFLPGRNGSFVLFNPQHPGLYRVEVEDRLGNLDATGWITVQTGPR